MADNFTKLWLQKTQNDAALKRAGQAISITGKALPCRVVAVDGPIVTVNFELNTAPWTIPQVQVPKAESNWIRMPTQVGDLGMVIPSDVYLGGISGLGGGVATMARAGGLGALVFLPVSNKNSAPDNPNAAQIMGPQGAIIRTQDNNCSLVLNESGVVVTFGSIKLTINSSGIHFTGAVTGTSTATFTGEGTFSGGHTVSAHTHGGVQSGGSTTAPPTG